MTEQSAEFLASLSHRWSLHVLAVTAVLGAATYIARVQQTGARTAGDAHREHAATVAVWVSGVLLGIGIVATGNVVLHFGCAELKAYSARCMSNVKILALGALMYSEDHDSRFPPSARWAEAIDARVRDSVREKGSDDDDPFRCPAATSPASYGMNARIGGVSLNDVALPAETVLLFDADAPTRSFAGGPNDLAGKRHQGAPNIAFTDGHAKYANAWVQEKLNWAPTPAKERGPLAD